MKNHLIACLLFTSVFTLSAHRLEAQNSSGAPSVKPSFSMIPLGVRGGLDESNLSSYLVGPVDSEAFICLDAGTIYSGIQKAIEEGALHGQPGEIIRQRIRGYFISHPHLDHVAGLILNSPDDSPKNIYGLRPCLDVLRDKYFTWESWANFADDGEKPQLKKYHYAILEAGKETPADRTPFKVTAYPLSHGAPFQSTAFLVNNGTDYLLYLGDTGADTIEHTDKLRQLWTAVAPLVNAGALKAIFIEVSFPDAQPDKSLFGHLTPRLLMQEIQTLTNLSSQARMQQLQIFITHRKPNGNQEAVIRKELEQRNQLGLRLVFPEQGKKYLL